MQRQLQTLLEPSGVEGSSAAAHSAAVADARPQLEALDRLAVLNLGMNPCSIELLPVRRNLQIASMETIKYVLNAILRSVGVLSSD